MNISESLAALETEVPRHLSEGAIGEGHGRISKPATVIQRKKRESKMYSTVRRDERRRAAVAGHG